jgi:DNA-binding SARP family transcriptional activator
LEVEADAGPLTIAGRGGGRCWHCSSIHANRVVSTSRVIDSLWGEDGPPSARAQVHSLISALRQELPDPAEGGPAIETRPEGYLLTVDPAAWTCSCSRSGSPPRASMRAQDGWNRRWPRTGRR